MRDHEDVVKRRLMNILAAASMLISIGTCALWVRSYWEWDGVTWRIGVQRRNEYQYWEVRIGSEIRVLQFSLNCNPSPRYMGGSRNKVSYKHMPADDLTGPEHQVLWDGWRKSALGFGLMHAYRNTGYSNRSVLVPHWFLALVFAALPGVRFYRWMKMRRRQKRGLCWSCGYDLRESEDR